MDQAKPIGQALTRHSPEPPSTSYEPARETASRAKDAAILALLNELALLYWRPDFTHEQSKMVLAQYLDDLRDFAIKDIQHAIKVYRRDPESKFFPHPGALRGTLETPPAWYALGIGKWLADCKRESEAELAKKEASLLRLTPSQTAGKGMKPTV